jgi:hypothetical protein
MRCIPFICTHIHVLNLWCCLCNEQLNTHTSTRTVWSTAFPEHTYALALASYYYSGQPLSSFLSHLFSTQATYLYAFQSPSFFRYSEVSSSPWLRVHAQAQAYLCPPVPPIPHRTQGQRLSDPAVDAFIVHAPAFTRLAGSRRWPTFLRSSTHSVCAEFSFQNVARLRYYASWSQALNQASAPWPCALCFPTRSCGIRYDTWIYIIVLL